MLPYAKVPCDLTPFSLHRPCVDSPVTHYVFTNVDQAAGSVVRHTLSEWGDRFIRAMSNTFYGKRKVVTIENGEEEENGDEPIDLTVSEQMIAFPSFIKKYLSYVIHYESTIQCLPCR